MKGRRGVRYPGYLEELHGAPGGAAPQSFNGRHHRQYKRVQVGQQHVRMVQYKSTCRQQPLSAPPLLCFNSTHLIPTLE